MKQTEVQADLLYASYKESQVYGKETALKAT